MAAVVEVFDELEIFERDGWVCQWCHEPVDPSLKGRHPMMKSLDHIVPLVRGGEHSRANTQLVHFRCNSAKKDR